MICATELIHIQPGQLISVKNSYGIFIPKRCCYESCTKKIANGTAHY